MPAASPRVLHVNDCASTTERLLVEAHSRGLPWRYYPLIDRRYPVTKRSPALKLAFAAPWFAELGVRARAADLLHVHYASVVRHTAWTRRDYVLHLHGSEIRSQQYEPRWTATIHRAVREARAVLYSTPELAEHVAPLRDDAIYLPVPVSSSGMPAWRPAQRPRVVFASRWDAVKGLATQLEVARRLRERLGEEVDLVGLDWGPGAADARAVGVDTRARMSHAAFLDLLATAHVVVGQASGSLGTSELEAMAIGVPVVARVEPRWHRGGIPAVLPAELEADGAAEVMAEHVVTALEDPVATGERLDGRRWVDRRHGVDRAVDVLVGLYDRVLG